MSSPATFPASTGPKSAHSSPRRLTLSPPPLPLGPQAIASHIDRSVSTPRGLLELHGAAIRSGHHLHPIVNFKLQRSYSSIGRPDLSLSLFRLTPDPNIFLWSSIIHAHALHGLHHAALLLFSQMLSSPSSPPPNAFTFSSALKASPINLGRALHSLSLKRSLLADTYVATALLDMYARGADVSSARKLFDKMPARSMVSYTAMVTCYAKDGNLELAQQMFDKMPERDTACWNTLMDGYMQHARPNDALMLFRSMLKCRVKPNEVTILSVLATVSQLGSLDTGKWAHSYAKSSRIPFTVRLCTALIDMYCKCGSLQDACSVFDSIQDKDVVAWNSMIVGYAMHGKSCEALRFFSEMSKAKVQPTDITFIGVLNACSHAGLVKEGREFFYSMEKDHGIEPKIEHYGCIVDLLGRAGLVEEAYDLVRNMGIKPDPVLWGSLLASCRLHKNMSLGEKIADFLLNNGLSNSGTFVLLSNLYAALGKWEKVARIRSLMKESGIPKEPGCTFIEVDRIVYEFVAGDLSHPMSKEIYVMLEELNELLRDRGYVSQTELILHDLEEPEKQQVLAVHSEKLAICFGLISTEPGTTIKIFKNLRVCRDCHTVTKLVSKITGRKIVMRDRSRFHHFVDGSCSCGDYY
ncbi:Pentatricopeptide repeat-containing protein [Platanthera guangdongensis]|uniref:Pentatricopeptide repeat-containing protein n=1 Tax=Platanthera guangdongensis TaxID=2320717 RepID=A0ABR2LZ65_9ASPA